MSDPFKTVVLNSGTRLQSGIPKQYSDGITNPNGLLLRAAVTATYVTDDPDHPYADDKTNPPVSVYCDVMTYNNISGQVIQPFKKVLVSQKGSLHNDRIWKPKATTANIKTGQLDRTYGGNPANWDGDHVLIGFINNNLEEPVIVGRLPHPSRDVFNENLEVGKRVKLKLEDGDPDFVKHHGTFYGVDDKGNFEVNSTFGNDGSIDVQGREPNPDTTGTSGNQAYKLPQDSDWKVVLYDMSIPESPVEIASLKFQKDNLEMSITGKLPKKAAVADYLKLLYETLKGKLDAFDGHTHVLTGVGTTLGPSIPIAAPNWDSNIESSKLTIPDN